MPQQPKRDWFKFWVYFFFGALLGLRFWSRSTYAYSTSMVPGAVFIGIGALIVGLIAGARVGSNWDEK